MASLDTGYVLDVSIPVGSTATLYLPLLRLANPVVVESGNTMFAGRAAFVGTPEIRSTRRDGNRIVLEAGSGVYRFSVPEKPLD